MEYICLTNQCSQPRILKAIQELKNHRKHDAPVYKDFKQEISPFLKQYLEFTEKAEHACGLIIEYWEKKMKELKIIFEAGI